MSINKRVYENYSNIFIYFSPDQTVQENILNVVPQSNISTATPFSPTPDFNLTTMSENDLINFINPTVFM